ncbi:unnamed protein product [Gordionus sp. m RMFG-2023]|uniref:biogenesis of lysosome-related organelles complex 1 subunit 1-like n=1 Tax=Gordionus sp. m RMFG-2023 TaxID=3053472 RepID=UPI0030E26748
MLSNLLKEHQNEIHKYKEDCNKKKLEAIEASKNLVSTIVDNVNESVARAYINQKQIENASKKLQIQINQYIKNTNQWLSLMENFHKSLKEIGDIENWSISIEKDLQFISEKLESKLGPSQTSDKE